MVKFLCLATCSAIVVTLSGCASTGFSTVTAGTTQIGELRVTTDDARWNRAPRGFATYMQKGSELWTRDGMLLDRLLIFKGINDGQPLFHSPSKALVYPPFSSEMQPNELLELTEDSLAKLFGTGTLVEASGLRPAALGQQRAVMFDMQISALDQPVRRGRALAFKHQGRLYMLLFVATDLYYFDRSWSAAERVMESAEVISTPAS